MHAPSLDLKPLPGHLKYVYLRKDETSPMIIANNLSVLQEEKLIRVLIDHKIAIVLTITDIKGIIPFMCMYWILLDGGANPLVRPNGG